LDVPGGNGGGRRSGGCGKGNGGEKGNQAAKDEGARGEVAECVLDAVERVVHCDR